MTFNNRDNLWPSPLSLKPGNLPMDKTLLSTISLFMPKSVESMSPWIPCSQISYLLSHWGNPEICNLSALSAVIFCLYTGLVFLSSCPLTLFLS